MEYKNVNLIVIGYNGRMCDHDVPVIVRPIYKVCTDQGEEDQFLIPPYQFYHDKIVINHIENQAELNRLESEQYITLLDFKPNEPPNAQNGYLLWLDKNNQLRYEPKNEVESRLKEFVNTNITKAWEILDRYKTDELDQLFDEADQLAQQAINADPNCKMGLVVKCVIAKMADDSKSIKYYTHIAQKIHPGFDLNNEIMIHYNKIKNGKS